MDVRGIDARIIDARGARFAASITVIVLGSALLLASPALLLIQAAVFAIGALIGPHRSPYAIFFRRWVAPRLRSRPAPEPIQPPQFAQLVGLIFAGLALLGALVAPPLFFIATAMAFGAAFLNAAFSYCLGCQMYLLLARMRGRLRTAR